MCTYLARIGATYYFRRPVPKDLIGHFKTAKGGAMSVWKVSLRVTDREVAKPLLRPHEIETDRLIEEARRELNLLPPLSPQEQAAQARAREEAAAMAALEAESLERQEARGDLRMLWRKRRVTSTAALTPEQAAAVDLLKEKDVELEQLKAAIEIMKKDRYGPTYQAEKAEAEAKRRAAKVAQYATELEPAASITGLYERYALSGSANPKTVARWRSRVASFVEYLDHDDVRQVSRRDLNRWTEALIAKGLAKKTVSDGYLPPIKLVMALALDDEIISANPAADRIKVRGPDPVEVRDRDLTDKEADIILRGSLQPQSDRLSEEHALARRWVPWLCAYTGARIAEMTQLRAGDIRQEQGVWVIYITPEAGSVKDSRARRVPLHPHLIEQGILALAKQNDWTPLFHREGVGNAENPASKMRASDLGAWVRTLGVDDPNVQPNHGWRHRFKTQARILGIPEELADRITGHAPRHQGGKYGKAALPVPLLLEMILKIPAYEVPSLPVFKKPEEVATPLALENA